MVIFLLSFVKGSKAAEGGKNPLADMDPGGPNPLGHRFASSFFRFFAFDLASPKDSEKPLEFRETRNPAFEEDLSIVDNEYILVKRGRDISDISVTSLSCKHMVFMKRFCPEGFNDADKILLTVRAWLF